MTEIVLLGKNYTIYASMKEAMMYGENVAKVYDAAPGDYVMASSGHALPVLGVEYSTQQGIRDILVYFGGKVKRMIMGETDVVVPFSPSRYYMSERTLDFEQITVAHMIAGGIRSRDAIERVYGKTNVPTFVIEKSLLSSRFFLHHLFNETEGFMGLKEEILKLHMDESYLAVKIHDLIEGDKVPANLRQWALNTVKEQLTEAPKRNMAQNTYYTQINNGSGAALPEHKGSIVDEMKRDKMVLPEMVEVEMIKEEKKSPEGD